MKKNNAVIVQQQGRSMVEMLGVLAIVGVLSAGGLLGYSQAMKKIKMNQTQEQIMTIMQNIRTKFAHTKRPQINSLEQAVELGIFPEEMVKSTTELVNKYQGSVTLETTKLDGKTVYKLSFNGLPDDVAAQLATMDWGNSSVLKLMLNESEE